MRIVQGLFWLAICFLIAPSKLAAIAYAIVIVGLLGAVLLVIIFTKALLRAIDKLFKGD